MTQLDKIDEILDTAKFEDFCYEVNGKTGYLYDDILAFLLWREIVIWSASDECIYAHVSDGNFVHVTMKNIPELCRRYIKDGHQGVLDWAATTMR